MKQNSKYSTGAFVVLLFACATTAFASQVDAIFTHAGLAIVRLGSSPPQRIVTGSRQSPSATSRSTVDGKLYLNYSKGVQKKWEQTVPGNIIKDDKSWPDLHK
jgi:hypothetical protein